MAVRSILLGGFSFNFNAAGRNYSPIFRQHKVLSSPRFGHFLARKMATGESALPSGTLLDFLLRDRHRHSPLAARKSHREIAMTKVACDLLRLLQGSFGPFGPKVQKKSENGFPGPLGPGGRKSRKSVEKESKVDYFWTFWTLFRLFFDSRAKTPEMKKKRLCQAKKKHARGPPRWPFCQKPDSTIC